MSRSILYAILVMSGLTAELCGAAPKVPTTAPAEPAARVAFQMAVYLIDPPKTAPAEIEKGLCKQFPHFAALPPKSDAFPSKPSLSVGFPPIDQYAPPDVEALKYSGRGLSKQQIEQLGKSRAVVAVTFFTPRARDRKTVRTACELMLDYARKSGGLLWDEETREVFGPDEWAKRRVDSWQTPGDVPRVERHINIHFYQPEGKELPRAITLGMVKFGCPDVVVNDLARQHSSSVGGVINLACQTMVERGGPSKIPGTIDVNVDRLAHKQYVQSLKKTYLDKATGRGTLTIASAAHEDGDPRNELIELTFENAPGLSVHERRIAFIAGLFGSHDEIAPVADNDPAMLAARAKARAQLPLKRVEFQAGLKTGEHMIVKAPFQTPDGAQEYMWVEVTAWTKDGKITGILSNDPANVPNLKSGAVVTVREPDVFDYILYRADGTTEGGETTKVLQSRSAKDGK